jgi:putative tryptophan/tyrosine transport system substrate-binding protein
MLRLGHMRRRDFVGGMTASALVARPARAQASLPTIGYLSARSPGDSAHIVAAFHQGLGEAGFVDKQSVHVEARFAEGDFDRLPALATELVRHQVHVLVATGGTVTALKAKPVVPATMPMVFAMGGDPVRLGVVASLSRPGGNVTGVSFLVNGLAAKGVEVLHDLVPSAGTIGLLVNPKDPNAEPDARETQAAVIALGKRLVIARAGSEGEIDAAFPNLVQQGVAALIVDTEPFFTDQRRRIVALAARHALPAVYQLREFVQAGGLISYGTSITDANRQLGVYAGRVLRGARPADLPVMQSTRFELIVNLAAARSLGLTVPPILLARADEVIE